ncbi:MAG: transcriptional repressor NrdR [bacterium]|nr:transcriptional repressor NrdR [bacterium]
MKCPYCGQLEDKVVDSRLHGNDSIIRRRRECTSCNRRFTTYERVEEVPVLVVKRGGNRAGYDRNKIIKGIMAACEKRPISKETIIGIVDSLEKELLKNYENEIPTSVIGEAVMAALRELDSVAYVRFASVYRSFEDVGEFIDEASKLIDRNEL